MGTTVWKGISDGSGGGSRGGSISGDNFSKE